MIAQMMVNFADVRKVDKDNDIKVMYNAECTVTENCSMINPVLRLVYTDMLPDCNYCYVPAWKRYYYITDVVLEAGRAAYVYLRCDVLNSFKQEIKKLYCNVSRNQNTENAYVPDNAYAYKNSVQVYTKYFDVNPFLDTGDINFSNNRVYMLTVIGGAKTILPEGDE